MANGKIGRAMQYVWSMLLGALLAVNYTLFVVPNAFAPSGVNGIAVMIQYAIDRTDFMAYMSLIINVPLCIFAYFKIDKDFALKTFCFTLVYSGVYFVLNNEGLPVTKWIDPIRYKTEGKNTIFPAIIAGLIMGVCIGFSVKNNSSTGGTDIIAKYVSKIKPTLNFFYVTFALNSAVAIASIFVFKKDGGILNYEPVCLCVIYSFISSFVGNRIIAGLKIACKFTIVTENCDEIEYEITHTLKHSATRLHGVGIYNHHDKEVLICIINRHQVADFEKIIKKYPGTFVYVETVDQTIGNFKRVK